MHERMEKWKGMDEIDEISNTRKRKEWKTNKKEMYGNLIKVRPYAPSIIRKEWYLVISKHVFMFKRMEEQGIFFIETELNYNLNVSFMMTNNYRDNQRRSLKLREILTTDQPDRDQLRI